MGAFAAFDKDLAALVLAVPTEPSTAPPEASGTAATADVAFPDAAMEWAALALAWPLA